MYTYMKHISFIKFHILDGWYNKIELAIHYSQNLLAIVVHCLIDIDCLRLYFENVDVFY